jgi:hypothetical protein
MVMVCPTFSVDVEAVQLNCPAAPVMATPLKVKPVSAPVTAMLCPTTMVFGDADVQLNCPAVPVAATPAKLKPVEVLLPEITTLCPTARVAAAQVNCPVVPVI